MTVTFISRLVSPLLAAALVLAPSLAGAAPVPKASPSEAAQWPLPKASQSEADQWPSAMDIKIKTLTRKPAEWRGTYTRLLAAPPVASPY